MREHIGPLDLLLLPPLKPYFDKLWEPQYGEVKKAGPRTRRSVLDGAPVRDGLVGGPQYEEV